MVRLKYNEDKIYNKQKIKKNVKKIIDTCILIILIIIFIFNLILLCENFFDKDYDKILGIYLFNIVSR